MMRLSDLRFIELLPLFMREDGAVKGLASAMDEIVPKVAERLKTASTWDCIDKLKEAELDLLASELNILWYNTNADIAIKRDVIKNSDKVYKFLGTKWAVENVIQSYFGDGRIEEWFEYGGNPGWFKVHSTNPSLSEDKLNEFLSLLQKVKRASAKLEGIYITLTGQVPMTAGFAYHEAGREVYNIGAAL